MRTRISGCCLLLLLCAFLAVFVSECTAQTTRVQLPTFHQFGVSTTVVVPDRGRVYLGGVNRSRIGSNRFGPAPPGMGNQGIGRTSAAGGLSVSATIIDHNKIDRALLAEAARRRGARLDIYGRPVAEVPRVPRDVVGQRWANSK